MTRPTPKETGRYFAAQAARYRQRSDGLPWRWLRARERAAIRGLLGGAVGPAALDLGAGAGYYSHQLVLWGARDVVAVDVSLEMLSQIDVPSVRRLAADAAEFSLANRFDTIICAGLLEFVSDPGAVLRNAHRHARPQCSCIVLVPAANIWGGVYRAFHASHGVTVSLFDDARLDDLARTTGWVIERRCAVHLFGKALLLRRCA